MQTPSKFFSLFVLLAGVFALASLPALTSASSYPSSGKRGGHHASMPRCEGPSRHGGKHRHMGRLHGPERMAKQLNVLETEIGIRANQLDAWRDFTDALLAMMKRPQRADGQPGMESAPQEPFGRAQRFAEMSIARGEAGADLLRAIEALRRTLTPEQLARVSEVESRMRAPHHRPSEPGHGPDEPETEQDPGADEDNPDSDAGPDPAQEAE